MASTCAAASRRWSVPVATPVATGERPAPWGWHAVQRLCLGDRPWLSREQIEQRLNRTHRAELQALMAPDRWWRKAEARAVANLQHSAFLQELERACTPMGAGAHSP